jgi:hypothetical protein
MRLPCRNFGPRSPFWRKHAEYRVSTWRLIFLSLEAKIARGVLAGPASALSAIAQREMTCERIAGANRRRQSHGADVQMPWANCRSPKSRRERTRGGAVRGAIAKSTGEADGEGPKSLSFSRMARQCRALFASAVLPLRSTTPGLCSGQRFRGIGCALGNGDFNAHLVRRTIDGG